MEETTPAQAATTTTPPTREELVARAKALQPLLRDQQAESEQRGYYSEEIHQAFLDAGFYHLLTPKRYGGFEHDLATFFQVMVEVSRGDPGVGWCLCLGHGHTLTTAAYFSEQAQEDVFNNPLGYFRASHGASKLNGTATPVEGGYIINARTPYESGVPYASHATVNAVLPAEDGEPPQVLAVLVPAGKFTMLDDWGGDAILGMRASGSNTVVVEDQFIPAHHAVLFDWLQRDHSQPTPGYLLHRNPMYLAPVVSFFFGEIASVAVGAAKAAVDEYEQILLTRTTLIPPVVPRYEDPGSQRELGLAMTMADAAEAILLGAGDRYLAACRAWEERGEELTPELDHRLGGMIQRAGQMGSETVEMLFRSAGSTAARRDQRMARYYRDMAVYRGHNTAQYLESAQRLGALHFGLPRTGAG